MLAVGMNLYSIGTNLSGGLLVIQAKTKIICLCILGAHFLISHILLPAAHKKDIFPFFTWELFSYVPEAHQWFFLRIISIDGRNLSPPEFFFNSRHRYENVSKFSVFLAPYQISALGTNLLHHSHEHIVNYKTDLERGLFPHYSCVTYEIGVANVNIRQLATSGTVEGYRPLRKFVYSNE